MSNIINIEFNGETSAVATDTVFRYDYGQQISFSDLDLPEIFEVHFSNVKQGKSTTQIGSDGVVTIPDAYLRTGLPIFGWIYLHSTDYDGETEYSFRIPVKDRATPSDPLPTPEQATFLTQVVNLVTTRSDEAEASAQDAEASATTATEQAQIATAQATAAASSAEEAEGYKDESFTNAGNALSSARMAKTMAERAEVAADSVDGIVAEVTETCDTAIESIQEVADTATEDIEALVETATTKAGEASASATAAANSASSASASASSASASKASASSAAERANASAEYCANAQLAAEEAADNAEASETQANGWMVDARTYAGNASASATAAASSASDAADSAEAAAQSAASLVLDDTLSESGQAAEAKAVGDALATKAEVDGYYEEMTVGDAEQLISSMYVEDAEPYNYRTTGGSADVGNREHLDKIVGGTVAWNQLVQTSSTSVAVQSGHKYFANINGTKSIGSSNGTAITINDGTKDNVIDLTQLFGTTIADYIYSLEQATAGAGVAWFKKLFPKDYYEYNAGELISVEGLESHDTVGFNAFDIATNKAELLGGMQYEIVGAYTSVSYEDINGNAETLTITNRLFTPTNNGTLTVVGADDTTCVHLVWSGYRNGEYEPYEKHSYPLDNSLTLRGIPKLDSSNNLYYDGDEYASDGSVNRKYGVVDLGTLTYKKYNVGTTEPPVYLFGTTSFSNLVDKNGDMQVVCPKYVSFGKASSNAGAYAKGNKTCGFLGGGDYRFYIRDDALISGTVEAFKTAMDGVMLVYKLATPTTETAEPYQQVQICDDFGTEEFVMDSIVPVGTSTRYPSNLRDKLQHLPNLADSDGAYLIRQTNKQMSLELFRIPKAPTTDGTYTLKATVSGGTPTYVWESEE